MKGLGEITDPPEPAHRPFRVMVAAGPHDGRGVLATMGAVILHQTLSNIGVSDGGDEP
jgi:hypothetical protein